jgi:hypothetical protein
MITHREHGRNGQLGNLPWQIVIAVSRASGTAV